MRRCTFAALILAFAAAAWIGACGGSGGNTQSGDPSGFQGPEGAPHPTGKDWLDPASANFHPKKISAACFNCHGATTFCTQCHFGPDGKKEPPGSDWTHGSIPHDFLAPSGPVCNKCHDLMRDFQDQPAVCHDCHAAGEAPHPVGQPWLDRNSPTFHGTQARENLASCAVCHGTFFTGGRTGVSCYSCHFGPEGSKVPAGENWTHGSVPHVSLASHEAVCNRCHDLTRTFENQPATCHDCHAGGGAPSHPTGQPWLDRNSPAFHGTPARQDPAPCAACHGSDYRGGIAGVSCFQCHFGPDGGKAPPGQVWTHGSVPHDFLASEEAVCNQCHGLTRTFENQPATCHDCHGAQASHPTGRPWLDSASPTFHGDEATRDLSACAACHGGDFRGGTVGVSCFQCHFGPDGGKVPEGESWTHGSVPHAFLAPDEAVCNQCHGLTRDFRNQPSSCHDCHGQQGSHPTGRPWLDSASSTFHGNEATRDLSACAACHGGDFRGGSVGVSCFRCHFGPGGGKVPEGESWTHGSVPHAFLAPDEAVCNQCHGLTRDFRNQPSSCHDCHGQQVAHPTGRSWLDSASPTFHGDEAARDLSACAACHGGDFRGGSVGVSCFQCHFGPDGGRVPDGESWTHGSVPHDFLASDEAICNRCHGLTRGFRNQPSTCHDCHGGVMHPTGRPWLDSASSTFHGTRAQQNLASCAACHGSDYRGGSAGVSCFRCHFGPSGSKVPDGKSWTHGTVPHDFLASDEVVCNQCHGLTRGFRERPADCHDCHGDVMHPTGRPWLDSDSSTFHGTRARQDLGSCAACHGRDYTGGSSGVSCFTCHFGTNGSKVPAGAQWSHGTVPHDSLASNEAVCNKCHGLTRGFRSEPSSCHDCHGEPMHPTGQPWLDKKRSTFHGIKARENLSSCASCHGGDYRGGRVGVSCYTCHFSPSGSKVPSGVHWTHGTVPHEDLRSYQAVCNKCHGVDRTYGNPPGNCHDCHGDDD